MQRQMHEAQATSLGIAPCALPYPLPPCASPFHRAHHFPFFSGLAQGRLGKFKGSGAHSELLVRVAEREAGSGTSQGGGAPVACSAVVAGSKAWGQRGSPGVAAVPPLLLNRSTGHEGSLHNLNKAHQI